MQSPSQCRNAAPPHLVDGAVNYTNALDADRGAQSHQLGTATARGDGGVDVMTIWGG